jgi:integrase
MSKLPRIAPVSGQIYEVERRKGVQLYAKWRDGRGQHQRKLGPLWRGKGRPPAGHLTHKAARDLLDEILVDARRDAERHPVARLLFEQVAADWMSHGEYERGLKPTTLMEYRSVLRVHLLPVFGGRDLDSLTTREIDEWRSAKLRAGASRRVANKCLMVLHNLLGWAVRHRDLAANPAVLVQRLPERYDAGDYRFYDVEQVLALARAAASQQDAALFLTAAFTGLRRGELVALRWRDVDFPAEAIRVMRSYSKGSLTVPKSNHSRVVPMVAQVAQALAGLWQRGHDTMADDLVFPGEEGGFLDASALRRRYCVACDVASLERLRFHDLRHTFGSLAINKASLVQVQHWLGHADIETTARYLHHKRRSDEAQLLAGAFQPEGARDDLALGWSREDAVSPGSK